MRGSKGHSCPKSGIWRANRCHPVEIAILSTDVSTLSDL